MSILSESEFQKLGRSGTQLVLKGTSVSLKTYMGEALNVRGKVVVTVKYGSQEMELPLLMIAGAGPALMGRNWLCKLNILNKVHQLQRSNTLETLLHKHEVVFNGELGLLTGYGSKGSSCGSSC